MSGMKSPGSANRNQKLFKAGVLALLVHIVFFIFMTFGLSWKAHPPAGIVVDLWSDLPQPEHRPIKKAKALPPKSVQPPKKVEPVPPKPDIELKKEKEKKKKQKLAKKKKEKEKKARLAREKKAEEKKVKEQKARVATEIKRLQKEQREEEERRRLQKVADAQAAAKRSLIDEYKEKILAKIKSRIVMPRELPNNPVAEYDIILLPGGEILNVKLRKTSGFRSFDEAVERAIILARPLPLPSDPALFSEFRNLSLKVHYQE